MFSLVLLYTRKDNKRRKYFTNECLLFTVPHQPTYSLIGYTSLLSVANSITDVRLQEASNFFSLYFFTQK